MRFEAKDGEATIWVYDAIGEMFGPDAISPKGVRDKLQSLRGVNKLTVRINSPGGLVDDAIAIRTLLADFSGEKTFKVDGIAASAATVLPTEGSKVILAPGSMWMIHNPWAIAIGDGDAMRKAAEISDKYRDNLVSIYAKRTGKKPKDIQAAMAAETWYTADEAMANGFADSVGGENVKASRDDSERIINYAKEVARLAAMALVAEQGTEAAEAVATQALEVGRKISAASRDRDIQLLRAKAASLN